MSQFTGWKKRDESTLEIMKLAHVAKKHKLMKLIDENLKRKTVLLRRNVEG